MNELLYNDFITLERAIISCLLIKPELTEQLKIEAKCFTKYRNTLLFMKNFYKQYRNYDITLMSVVCMEKTAFIDTVSDLIVYCEPSPMYFKEYQERLVMLYNGEVEEKKNIKTILNLAVQLKAREISVEEFRKEVEKI